MIAKEIPVAWILENEHRLDCGPFVKGSLETRKKLEAIPLKKDKLEKLTRDGITGIYHVGQEKLRWVTGEKYGVSFLRSSDILKADISGQPMISKEQVAKNPLFKCPAGSTLITRSGTIGRMAYCRQDMAKMAMSQDVLKVVPDTDKVPSGYLYAFLNSKFGIPMVVGGTFGSIIVHIEAENIADLPVPRLGDAIEGEIHRLVEEAAELRVEAISLLDEGRETFYKTFNIDQNQHQAEVTNFSVNTISSKNLSRLDAVFFSESGRKASELLATVDAETAEELGKIASVFTPGIFKRPYVDDPNYGYPYFSGSELFLNDAEPRGYLNKRAQGIENYIVKKNWLLIQDAGQLGGLIGKVVRVNHFEDKSVVSNHLMRIAPQSDNDAGYLFTVVSSIVGYNAVVRNAFGTSIPQLDPAHIGKMKIPWPHEAVRKEIAKPVLKAWGLQDRAIQSEREAIRKTELAIEQAAQVKH